VIRAKLSTSYAAKKARIRRLPRLVLETAEVEGKRRALKLIERFRSGIKDDQLGLRRLRPRTIARKERRGLDAPGTPLYALGPARRNTYMNMMRISQLKKGWRVAPSKARHHESKLSLAALFTVHEFGTTIKQRRGRKVVVIRIPPRFAFANAYQALMADLRRQEPKPAVEVRRAIRQYVRDSRDALLRKVMQRSKGYYDWDGI
jgi:hypothetical protein